MHTSNDSIAQLNLDYLLEQMNATIAIAAHLAVPIGFETNIFLPFIVMPYD